VSLKESMEMKSKNQEPNNEKAQKDCHVQSLLNSTSVDLSQQIEKKEGKGEKNSLVVGVGKYNV
jgi:hypothetical protein